MKCEKCGVEFEPTRSKTKFCNSKCRKLFYYHNTLKIRRQQQNIKNDPKSKTSQFDRTNYNRGNGVIGYPKER